MRPRVFPAEDQQRQHDDGGAGEASMRPRVFPAEDGAHRPGAHSHARRFNEAAGIPRGRQLPVGLLTFQDTELQ